MHADVGGGTCARSSFCAGRNLWKCWALAGSSAKQESQVAAQERIGGASAYKGRVKVLLGVMNISSLLYDDTVLPCKLALECLKQRVQFRMKSGLVPLTFTEEHHLAHILVDLDRPGGTKKRQVVLSECVCVAGGMM